MAGLVDKYTRAFEALMFWLVTFLFTCHDVFLFQQMSKNEWTGYILV